MKPNYPASLTFLGIAAILWLRPFHAVAGGFLLFEQGVKDLGNSFAGGAAVAEDPSTIFYIKPVCRAANSRWQGIISLLKPSLTIKAQPSLRLCRWLAAPRSQAVTVATPAYRP